MLFYGPVDLGGNVLYLYLVLMSVLRYSNH